MSTTGVIFRLLLKAMVPLSIVLGAMFYLSYLNGRDPLAMFDNLFGKVQTAITEAGDAVVNIPDAVDSSIEGQTRTFHKWQDATGAWHYGENPPADARSLTAISLSLDDNVVPSTVLAKPQEKEGNPQQPQVEMPGLASPYSPSQIKKLFEDTKQLQETLNQRRREQDAMFGIVSDPE